MSSGSASGGDGVGLPFSGLLFPRGYVEAPGGAGADPRALVDLNLDQVVTAISGGDEFSELVAGLLRRPLEDAEVVRYRQEVFADLTLCSLAPHLEDFAATMHRVRSRLHQLGSIEERYYRAGWFLDAAATYCTSLQQLEGILDAADLASRALSSFRRVLGGYLASPAFTSLAEDARQCREALAGVRYCVRVAGLRVEVSRYRNEADYSTEVEQVFSRFEQGEVTDYRVHYRVQPGMSWVGGQILQAVSRLFAEQFQLLDAFCVRHADFFDDMIGDFDRDLHFYLAYLRHIAPLQRSGLPFCLPDIAADLSSTVVSDAFDVALATKLVAAGAPVVCNDVRLEEHERIIVVTGPNQGGKTTFARMVGQLHHLASLGCPVPATSARLAVFDRIFTHFPREEGLSNPVGKLEDDVVRIAAILAAATPRSIVITNEIFTSTTLQDAHELGEKAIAKVLRLGCRCVWVTFVDELASYADSVVSMVSTVAPDDPARRTFRIVRAPANGSAYAFAIAEKYGLTYDRLVARVVA